MNAGVSNISYENIVQLAGSNHWVLHKRLFIIPKNTKKIRILLALANTNSIILFDDIKVVSISEITYVIVTRKDALK